MRCVLRELVNALVLVQVLVGRGEGLVDAIFFVAGCSYVYNSDVLGPPMSMFRSL